MAGGDEVEPGPGDDEEGCEHEDGGELSVGGINVPADAVEGSAS